MMGGAASAAALGARNTDAQILAANPGLVTATATGQIATPDSALDDAGLPGYPLLSGSLSASSVEEIRRSVAVEGLDSLVSAQQCMEFFGEKAGEVKYFRFCTRAAD